MYCITEKPKSLLGEERRENHFGFPIILLNIIEQPHQSRAIKLISLGVRRLFVISKSSYEFRLFIKTYSDREFHYTSFFYLKNLLSFTIFEIFTRNQFFVKSKISCFFHFNLRQLSQFLEILNESEIKLRVIAL